MDAIWDAALSAFLESVYQRSGSTKSRATYSAVLSLFFRCTDNAPAEVTQADVRAFLTRPASRKDRIGRPIAASTRNGRLTALNSFYSYASTYEVDGQPLYTKPLPTRGFGYVQPPLRFRAMTEGEITRLFAAIPDTPQGIRDRSLFLVYFWTVRRAGEIIRLRWRDILPATFPGENGTTRAGFSYRYISKGHARETRMAELPMPAYTAIIHYLKQSGRLATIQPDHAIFQALTGKNRRSHAPMHPSTASALFHAYLKKAGLPVDHLSLHSLRHTGARERYAAGQDIISVKDLLGHVNLQTTFTYLQNLVGTADKGVALIADKFAHLSGVR